MATFGPKQIEDQPECAVVIARTMATWSYIEADLALLLASLLHIGQAPAAAIFLAINNSRTQQEVLLAAAESVLNSSDFEMISALMGVVKTIEKDRNPLGHGIFGGSQFVPGLMWTEQKHYVSHTVQVWASDFKNIDNHALYENTYVYTQEDLETVAGKLEWLQQYINSVRGYLSSDNIEWRAERRRQLCVEPLIAQEISRMRAGQKSGPIPESPQAPDGKKVKR